MPRTARIVLPGVAMHVTHRGHNRAPCFFGAEDYALYLELLARFAREHLCSVHAYCLMTNHVHLLLTPRTHDGCALMMKRVAQNYTQYVNKARERTGSLWSGRFHSCLVTSDRYALACYRYVELNPVKAGLAVRPEDYRWSSYGANTGRKQSPWLDPHPSYPGAAAYRGLFSERLDEALVDDLRRATQGGYAAGAIRRSRGRLTTENRESRAR